MNISRSILQVLGLLVCVSIVSIGHFAYAGTRVALVVGNANYLKAPALVNTLNDANEIAKSLKALGFKVILRTNTSKRGLERAIAELARMARGADAAMFYYAGHAMQFQGRNYLLPVDTELRDEISIRFELVGVDDIQASLRRAAGVKIMVLDACRDNPLAKKLLQSVAAASRGLGGSRGLARIRRAGGTIVAYATQADDVAADGLGHHSPFTEALLKEMKVPGVEIGAMFRRVASRVYFQTKGKQEPEISISLRTKFYLNNRESDTQHWARIRRNNDQKQMRDFLRDFPKSIFAPDAKYRLDAIRQKQEVRRALAALTAEQKRLNAERTKMGGQLARVRSDGTAASERQKSQGQQARHSRLPHEQDLRTKVEQEQKNSSVQNRPKLAREALRKAREEGITKDNQQAKRPRSNLKAREQALTAIETRMQTMQKKIAALTAQLSRREINAAKGANKVSALGGGAEIAPKEVIKSPVADINLVVPIKRELRRIGCYSSRLDRIWKSRATRRALRAYARYAKLGTPPAAPSALLLEQLQQKKRRICPLVCKARYEVRSGKCVQKSCRRGQYLDRRGKCVGQPVRKTKVNPPPRKVTRPSVQPTQRSELAVRRMCHRKFFPPGARTFGWDVEGSESAHGLFRNCMVKNGVRP